jgi:hypothetical protein
MSQSYRTSLAAAIVCCTLFTVSVWTSCKKDLCKDTTCLNGGVCDDGKCECPEGFEGDGCEIDKRGDFRGDWAGKGCGKYNLGHVDERLTIKTADSVGFVKLVYNGYSPVFGKVADNSLSIESQPLLPSGSSGGFGIRYIQGSMTRDRNTITFQYDYEEYSYGKPEPIYYKCEGSYMRD